MFKALLLMLDGISSAAKLEFVIAIALLGGSLGVELWGITVPGNMHMLFGVGGMFMLFMASYTNIKAKERVQRMKELDAEARIKNIEAGHEDDGTIIDYKETDI